MRNNIASFEKTSHSKVKIMEKINAEFFFSVTFCPKFNLTSASFLIYLLADKAKNQNKCTTVSSRH